MKMMSKRDETSEALLRKKKKKKKEAISGEKNVLSLFLNKIMIKIMI